MSAFPPIATVLQTSLVVRFVPTTVIQSFTFDKTRFAGKSRLLTVLLDVSCELQRIESADAIKARVRAADHVRLVPQGTA
jgi:hypothetical protein